MIFLAYGIPLAIALAVFIPALIKTNLEIKSLRKESN